MKTNTINTRTIQTPFSSTKAYEVLSSVLGQMSDGMWENSGRMDKYWRFADVKQAANGNVYLEISDEDVKPDGRDSRGNCKWVLNGFVDMNDEAILQFFAAKIKHIMQEDLKDANITNGWRRDYEAFHTAYLNYKEDITVAEVYCIYDILKHRSLKTFKAEVVKAVLGCQKSKEEVAALLVKQTALAEAAAELNTKVKELEAALNIAVEQLKENYSNERAKLYREHAEKMAAANINQNDLIDI